MGKGVGWGLRGTESLIRSLSGGAQLGRGLGRRQIKTRILVEPSARAAVLEVRSPDQSITAPGSS